MNLSNLSIRRPVTTVMIILAVLIFGFVSLPKMAIELYPEMNLPVAVVVTSYKGATPEEVEKLVTKPIESVVGTVANVEEIYSNSAGGSSQVIVLFDWGTDMNVAIQDIRDQIDLVRGMLPESADSPRILRFDPNSEPIITVSLAGTSELSDLKSLAEEVIKPALERIDGVASVSVSGGQDRVIEIVLDPQKMDAYGLNYDQIKQALAAENISGSAGKVVEGDKQFSISVKGEFQDVAEIANTPIPVGTGTIPLYHVAEVKDTFTEQTYKSYTNGQPAITLSVMKASGGNTVEVADEVKQTLKDLEGKLPSNAKLTLISDSSKYIKDSIYNVAEHTLLGALFAIIVLFFFLNSIRSVLIVSIVIPISIISTFCLMYFTGHTINVITLSGLTLGLGSLVDFAIVILENIFRLRQEGKNMLEAALLGSSQVGNAVMASGLAQICVFLPVVFVEGLAKELFGPLALTVVFSHVAALIVTFMLVPMLSSRWLKRLPHMEKALDTYRGFNPAVWFNIFFNRLSRGYGRLLAWAIRHRKTVFSITTLLFIGSILLVPFVGMEFMPQMDQGAIRVTIELPLGTELSETEKVVSKVEQFVREIPELKLMTTSIGMSGGPSVLASSVTNRATIDIQLVDLEERKRSTKDVAVELSSKVSEIAGAKIEVTEVDQSGSGFGQAPVQINLRGDDLKVLEEISALIAAELEKVPGTRNVSTSLEQKVKEIRVVVDPQKASLYGLNAHQILSAVRIAFDGEVVTRYRTGDDEIDVRLRLPREFQDEIDHLKNLRIPTPTGAQVALSSVADIVKEDVPQTIQRHNQSREIQITSELYGRDLGSVTRDVQAILQKIHLPEGYQAEIGGESQDMAESFSSLFMALLLAVVLVYMVMAGQFESLFSPFIIMFSVPPTFIGVVLGLLVTHTTLNVSALIGYILLVGLVVNNAIVLIDFVNTLRKEGMERDQAILKAGPVRLRPILMTTLSTSLAVVPLAFGGGTGNESLAPMAIVVIFGLSFSTLITLVLIPVVYTWFDDLGRKFRRRKFRKAQMSESM